MPVALSEILGKTPAAPPPDTSDSSRQNFYSFKDGDTNVVLPSQDNRGQNLTSDEAISQYRRGTLVSLAEGDDEKVKSFLTSASSSASGGSPSRKTSDAPSDSAATPPTGVMTLKQILAQNGGGKPAAPKPDEPYGTRHPAVKTDGQLNLPGTILLSKFDDPDAVRAFLQKSYGEQWKSEDYVLEHGHDMYEAATKAGHQLALGRGFLEKTMDTLKGSWDAIKDHPGKTALGAGKAAVAGGLGLAEEAVAGLHGLTSWVRAKAAGEDAQKAGKAAVLSDEQIAHIVHQKAADITGINLQPAGKEDEAMARAFGIPMDALSSSGLTIKEYTGNDLLAAGAEGFGAYLMLRPGIASDMMKVISRGKAAPGFEATFREKLAKSREEGYDYADKVVSKTDPELAERMRQEALTQPGVDPTGKQTEGLTPKAGTVSTTKTEDVSTRVIAVTTLGTKTDNSFDELAIKNKELAQKLAQHVKKDDQDLGNELLAKLQGHTTNAKIEATAKKSVEGETIKGKDVEPEKTEAAPKVEPPPPIKVVPPKKKRTSKKEKLTTQQQKDLEAHLAGAQKTVDATKGAKQDAAAKGNVNRASKDEVLRQLKTQLDQQGTPEDRSSAPHTLGVFDRVYMQESSGALHSVWKDVEYNLFSELIDRESFAEKFTKKSGYETAERPPAIYAHEFLDLALKHMGEAHPYSNLVKKLRSKIDDVPLHFTLDPRPNGVSVHGFYNFAHHEVVSKPRIKTVLHELVHAQTVRWMWDNPTHELVKRIEALKAIARNRAARMGVSASEHYGLKPNKYKQGPIEFLSEALSNPTFQKFLVDSEKFAQTHDKVRSVLSGIIETIQKIFGITDSKDAKLLHDIAVTSEEIFNKQADPSFKYADDRRSSAIVPSLERVQAGLRNTIAELGEDDVEVEPENRPFTMAPRPTNKIKLAQAKLQEYVVQVQKLIAPEALGPEAKTAAATIAKAMSQEAQKTSSIHHQSAARRAFWDKNSGMIESFVSGFEKGQEFGDSRLNKAAEAYRWWNKALELQDLSTGFKYEPVDNYLAHIFKDRKGVEDYFTNKYGAKWGDPSFIKDRTFNLYEEAVKAGFEPKYKNPEDIMQARQHASDVAQMRVQVLNELVDRGLAVKITKAKGEDGKMKSSPKPRDYNSTFWRSPTGDGYWVHNVAHAVMDNAFNSRSLWNEQGIHGDAFRGTMYLKNALVPVKLALSLFHPLHVVGIDNAATMMRTSKGLLSGEVPPHVWLKNMVKSGLMYESLPFVGSHSRLGSRVLQVWQGKIKGESLTAADRTALQYMGEGGFIPELSSQYRTKAVEQFARAARQGQYVKAGLTTIPALIEGLNKPVFEKWIPGLKIASYLNDVDMAIKTHPELLENNAARQLAFRKIAKSVDNRYGEMAYNTLFWNKWVKDISVASTLSLGWNLGFIREYGGGALDLGKAATSKGGAVGKIAKGDLDRPLFVLAYTSTALAYGGLMTYMLTGKPPQELKDYVYPQSGGVGPNGQPNRVNTMFYTREFGAIYSHVKEEGLASGTWKTIAAKASPLLSMISAWATNVDYFGKEISNPNDPAYKRLEQKVKWSLSDLEPLSLSNTGSGSPKDTALSIAGFTPAPKYATNTPVQAATSSVYNKYHRSGMTSYDKAMISADTNKLRKLMENDEDSAEALIESMTLKYDLSPRDVKNLTNNVRKGGDPSIYMFSRLDWREQKRILDENWKTMTEDEQDEYLKHSNKDHLRGKYEPPEESE